MNGTRKKVAIALGAGSIRGLAHIGVLKVLEEENIPIDIITGTSAGSIVGGIYAAGTDLGILAKFVTKLSVSDLINFSVPKMALVRNTGLKELLRIFTKGKKIEELAIPFAAVATDLERAEEVIIREGDLLEAMMASSAIPGVFRPVMINNRMCVDGAVLNCIPAIAARKMGADIVIGCDVGVDLDGTPRNILGIIMKSISILERELSRFKTVDADIIIRPDIGHVGSGKIEQAEFCIEQGEKSTRELIPKIKELLSSFDDSKVMCKK